MNTVKCIVYIVDCILYSVFCIVSPKKGKQRLLCRLNKNILKEETNQAKVCVKYLRIPTQRKRLELAQWTTSVKSLLKSDPDEVAKILIDSVVLENMDNTTCPRFESKEMGVFRKV